MENSRIAALLEPFLTGSLSPGQLAQISIYIDLLLRWNARMNLTAVRKPEEIVTRHFGESLFLARYLFPAEDSPSSSNSSPPSSNLMDSVLDIGSGAGFPALPLKIWAKNISLTMVESNHKKAAFLREAARAMTLSNVTVIAERAETLMARADRPRTKVVTLRAVEHFDAILSIAASFLLPGGTLAMLIGENQTDSLSSQTTFAWRPPIRIPLSDRRILLLGTLMIKSGVTALPSKPF